MKQKTLLFRIVDWLYLAIAALPLLCGIVLNILTKPPSEGISIAGARIFFTVPMPLQDLPVTEAQVNSFLVIISHLYFTFVKTICSPKSLSDSINSFPSIL